MKTHGKRYTRLYRIWLLMKNRCNNPNASNWLYYGGKGVRVCKAWQTFEGFYCWAVSHGYSDDLTIDRIKASGNYCPSNCRWATKAEQQQNRPSKYTKRKQGRRVGRPVKRSDGVIFSNMTIAAEHTDCHVQNIQACCAGRAKTSGGFGWGYL